MSHCQCVLPQLAYDENCPHNNHLTPAFSRLTHPQLQPVFSFCPFPGLQIATLCLCLTYGYVKSLLRPRIILIGIKGCVHISQYLRVSILYLCTFKVVGLLVQLSSAHPRITGRKLAWGRLCSICCYKACTAGQCTEAIWLSAATGNCRAYKIS